MKYIYEHSNWTDFTWDAAAIMPSLERALLAQGILLGRMDAIGLDGSFEIEADSLADGVVASSRIEEVELDVAKVRSSVVRQLGGEPESAVDTHDVDGIVSVSVDASVNHAAPLTEERLLGWHEALFPTGHSGLHRIEVGCYRSGPMSVVNGPVGHEREHYRAPEAGVVPVMMRDLLSWIDKPAELNKLLRAGIAHLWFLTIHPFDDGNGRIARAISEMMICRSCRSMHRYCNLSRYILSHRESYYDALERAQRGTSDITSWLAWFLEAVAGAFEASSLALDDVLRRNRFWESVAAVSLNARQRRMLERLLAGFEGKLTAAKWAKMCKVSPDTALRDINDLICKGILARGEGGGRSTSYMLSE